MPPNVLSIRTMWGGFPCLGAVVFGRKSKIITSFCLIGGKWWASSTTLSCPCTQFTHWHIFLCTNRYYRKLRHLLQRPCIVLCLISVLILGNVVTKNNEFYSVLIGNYSWTLYVHYFYVSRSRMAILFLKWLRDEHQKLA